MSSNLIEATAAMLRHGFGRVMRDAAGHVTLEYTYTPAPGEKPQAFLARVAAQTPADAELDIEVRAGRLAIARVLLRGDP